MFGHRGYATEPALISHRIAPRLALSALLVCAALVPATAQAQIEDPYPSDVEPPSWWWETLGPPVVGYDVDCVKKSYFLVVESSLGPKERYGFSWGPAASPGSGYYDTACTRLWGDRSVLCKGYAEYESGAYSHRTHSFSCGVYRGKPPPPEGNGGPPNKLICARYARFTLDQPFGPQPEVVEDTDSGWYPRDFGDCRPSSLDGWPDNPGAGASEACERAKQKVKEAKQKLHRADTPGEKAKARAKLKKAKKKKKEACD